MFEDEYRQMHQHRMNIERWLKDTSLLYPPTTTPLSGVEFIMRLPSGDIERTRRVRFIVADLHSQSASFSPSAHSRLPDDSRSCLSAQIARRRRFTVD